MTTEHWAVRISHRPLREKQYSIQPQYKKANTESSVMALQALIDHGGLKSIKSSVNMTAGIAWKPKSGIKGSSCPGGTTNVLSTARRLQYRMLTGTSRGVAHTESMFFRVKSCLQRETSARRPTPNVIVDIVSAMKVGNWYEPPNPLCRGFVMLGSHEYDAAKNRSPVTWMIAETLLGEEVSLRRACVVALVGLLSTTNLNVRDDTYGLTSRINGMVSLCSDFGWSIFFDTYGERDPAETRPEILHVQCGTPVRANTGERKIRIRDGLHIPTITYPNSYSLEHGASYKPRAAASSSVRTKD